MAILALGIVLAAFIAAGAIRDAKLANDTITVTGSAKKPIRSDFVVWRGAVSCQRSNLQEAYREVIRYTERLKQYFTQRQIPDSLVTFRPLETMQIPEYTANGSSTGRISAYNLRQSFEIRSSQVDKISSLSGQAMELINEGVNLESYPPEYLYTRLAELRSEMLAQAAADAKNRAESIASSVDCKIGAVRSVRMGVFQITARNSTDVSDYGIYDTMSLDKDITAVVSMTFAVK
ncbi:MAG: SIMPL domain-containing protein [bacterium]|nr:SIMPL domain-containing protein [bacterium]